MSFLAINEQNFNFSFLSAKTVFIAAVFSGLLMLLSAGSVIVRGLNLGIDFTGGTLVEIGYGKSIELTLVRSSLEKGGYKDAVVQYFGTDKDVLVRLGVHENKTNETLSNEIVTLLQSDGHEVEMRRVEFVGPQVGGELIESAGLALLYTFLGILAYVSVRFEKRFALGAVLALVHDVLITAGVFSVFQLEFDLTVLAALLAVVGYSLNDTIVVFDRIRDNFLKMRKISTIDVMNISLNQTLIRTIMTSFTTLLSVLALYFWGGEMIHGFATALIVGIVVGTYSSIYVASALALKFGVSKGDLAPVVKEAEVIEERPYR